MKEILAVKCDNLGINAEIYEADYNQYVQEILDDSSGLYRFKPELIILFADCKTIFETFFSNHILFLKKTGKNFQKTKTTLSFLLK